MTYTVTSFNVHIEGSHAVPKAQFRGTLDSIAAKYPFCHVFELRTPFSLRMEWAAHNGLYSLGIARDRTADVDLNAPLSIPARLAYAIAGLLSWPFIK